MSRWDSEPVLLGRARGDLQLVRKVIDDPEVADEIVGFHAQQAVEKALKAVLESRGVDYPYTHDLERLLELLQRSGEVPSQRDDLLWLTPWAAELRYAEPLLASLDRPRALAVAESLFAWAEGELTGP